MFASFCLQCGIGGRGVDEPKIKQSQVEKRTKKLILLLKSEKKNYAKLVKFPHTRQRCLFACSVNRSICQYSLVPYTPTWYCHPREKSNNSTLLPWRHPEYEATRILYDVFFSQLSLTTSHGLFLIWFLFSCNPLPFQCLSRLFGSFFFGQGVIETATTHAWTSPKTSSSSSSSTQRTTLNTRATAPRMPPPPRHRRLLECNPSPGRTALREARCDHGNQKLGDVSARKRTGVCMGATCHGSI